MGNPMMGVYDAWNRIVQFKGSTAVVNLLLNRASCYLDVKSELPYRGRVDIVTKSSVGPLTALEVRIPDHTYLAAVGVSVSGQDLAGQWRWVNGSYVHIPNLRPSAIYTLTDGGRGRRRKRRGPPTCNSRRLRLTSCQDAQALTDFFYSRRRQARLGYLSPAAYTRLFTRQQRTA
jgi:hypothetical protein